MRLGNGYMKSVVFSPTALFRLSRFSIGENWFQDFPLPDPSDGLKRIVLDGIIYIIEERLEVDNGPIVVINVSHQEPVFFDGGKNVAVLERVITVGRSLYTDSVAVSSRWWAPPTLRKNPLTSPVFAVTAHTRWGATPATH